jgi:uncharacterized damage-inducible protein DinB
VIDFSPIHVQEITVSELSRRFTVQDLRDATNHSIDTILDIIKDADDAQMTHIPYDPDANDKHAPEDQQNIGWSLAHLVVHVTASSEEWATFSSILARGVPYPAEPRLRYETPWETVTTRAQAVQRLEESRRMRLAYLDTWPDQPNLETFRDMSERFIARFGPMNAPACFLFGLSHETGHHDQFREAARQAREAALA